MEKDQKRFEELLKKYPAEPTSTSIEVIDNFYDDVKYSDEEIIFMATYDFDRFSNRFPGLAEYYMECLD